MRVILRRGFFSSNKQRFKRSNPRGKPVFVPDHLHDELPKSAVIVDDDYVAPEKPKEPETLAQAGRVFTPDPAAETIRIQTEAENERRVAAEKFRKEREAEEVVEQPVKRGPGRPRKQS